MITLFVWVCAGCFLLLGCVSVAVGLDCLGALFDDALVWAFDCLFRIFGVCCVIACFVVCGLTLRV